MVKSRGERTNRDPAKARKLFDIKPGDNLIILGDEGQGIAIIKEKGLEELLGAARKMQ